jgi:hypothetical protein
MRLSVDGRTVPVLSTLLTFGSLGTLEHPPRHAAMMAKIEAFANADAIGLKTQHPTRSV